MSDLPKCKLCGADAAMHKVFGGIKYCCSSETCTMHDVLMLKNQWRTLMGQQQAAPVGVVREFHVDWRDKKPPEGTELYSCGSLGPSLLEQSDLEFIAARLGRVANRVGYPMPSGDAQSIVSLSGSILGAIAYILDGDTRWQQSEPSQVPTGHVYLPEITPEMWETLGDTDVMTWIDGPQWTQIAVDFASMLPVKMPAQPAPIPTAWQPIETAPYDVYVLVHYAKHITDLDAGWAWDDDDLRTFVAKKEDCLWVQNVGIGEGVIVEPTHWMPLPPAPEVSDGTDQAERV